MRVAIASIFFLNGASSAYRKLEVGRPVAGLDDRLGELGGAGAAVRRSRCGRPRARRPRGQALHERRAPRRCPPGRWLTATTGSMPNSRTFSMCLARFSQPTSISAHRLGRVVGLRQAAAAVHAERAHRRDDDHRVRAHAAGAADDVHELLHAQVGREAGLRDQVVAELQAERGRRRSSCCRGRCWRTARRASGTAGPRGSGSGSA